MERRKQVQIVLVICTMIILIAITAIFFFVPGPGELEEQFHADFSSAPDLRIVATFCVLIAYFLALARIFRLWKRIEKSEKKTDNEMYKPLEPH